MPTRNNSLTMGRLRAAGASVLAAAIVLASGCGGPPQVGADDDCFVAIDALWTAVTAKRLDLLDASASKLKQLRATSQLPDPAFESLEPIIETARAGNWTSAAKELKHFIEVQRRK